MLMQLDCIPCLLKMSLSGIRQVTDDQATIEAFFKRILKMDALSRFDITPPELIEIITLELLKLGQNPDPFLKVKEEQNKKALALYPWATRLVDESEYPFATAVKLSIAGNLIDSLIDDEVSDLKSVIQELLTREVSYEKLTAFWQKIESSRLILYLGDNSGEIVFDRVLIEFIKQKKDVDVYFVVRKDPVLNDVTMKEATAVGMEKVACVIENGILGPLPGTIIARLSPGVKKIYEKADLIISKGGGNYDAMNPSELTKNTTFLLNSKCSCYCRLFGVKMHDPIIENVYYN